MLDVLPITQTWTEKVRSQTIAVLWMCLVHPTRSVSEDLACDRGKNVVPIRVGHPQSFVLCTLIENRQSRDSSEV